MAANNATAVAQNSVAERRLRPIYDWLDNGNNKKALQEVTHLYLYLFLNICTNN